MRGVPGQTSVISVMCSGSLLHTESFQNYERLPSNSTTDLTQNFIMEVVHLKYYFHSDVLCTLMDLLTTVYFEARTEVVIL